MTDNEKRAHDLAMLYMAKQLEHNYYDIVAAEHYTRDINRNYVSGYTDIYLIILERLNQDLM